MHAPHQPAISDLPAAAVELLSRLRRRAPRVHCLTNVVAQNFTANVLLAIGATPSMTIAPDEIAEFVARADSLLVNLGTLDEERRAAAAIAIEAANDANRPWVLDPVLADRSQLRTGFARSLASRRPTAMRLNHVEFATLAGRAADDEAVAQFAKTSGTVVGLTGEVDCVTDGTRLVRIANGHPLMGRVTAMGCALSAVAAAFLAVGEDAWSATAAALIVFGVAGEIAGEVAHGPGSFAPALLDALYTLDDDMLRMRARLSP